MYKEVPENLTDSALVKRGIKMYYYTHNHALQIKGNHKRSFSSTQNAQAVQDKGFTLMLKESKQSALTEVLQEVHQDEHSTGTPQGSGSTSARAAPKQQAADAPTSSDRAMDLQAFIKRINAMMKRETTACKKIQDDEKFKEIEGESCTFLKA